MDEGWGTKVIERLSADLRGAFPDMKGLSSRNLEYMRRFSEAWPEREIVQRLVAQIPWGHNVRLIDKLSSAEERLWYARKTIEHAWSRNVLVMQIEPGLIHRQGAAVTNFDQRLPAHQSDLASDPKDPYIFGFLGVEGSSEPTGAHHVVD